MTTDECAFELNLDDDVTYAKCGRKRPFPEDGKLTMREAGATTYVVDTHIKCGDGGMGCQETRVKIRLGFGFG